MNYCFLAHTALFGTAHRKNYCHGAPQFDVTSACRHLLEQAAGIGRQVVEGNKAGDRQGGVVALGWQSYAAAGNEKNRHGLRRAVFSSTRWISG